MRKSGLFLSGSNMNDNFIQKKLNMLCGGTVDIKEKIQNEIIEYILNNVDTEKFQESLLLIMNRLLKTDQDKYYNTYIELLNCLSKNSIVIEKNIFISTIIEKFILDQLFIEKYTRLDSFRKLIGNILYLLDINEMIKITKMIEVLHYDTLIGYVQQNKNIHKEFNSTSFELLEILQTMIKENKIESKMQICLIETFFDKKKKISNTSSELLITDDRLDSRASGLWIFTIQYEGKTERDYEVITMPERYLLKTLIKDFNLKSYFCKNEKISAFNLFQNGYVPEWSDERIKGGGRYLIKTPNWEKSYEQIFTWLESLSCSSETLSLLNIIAGFRFKIKPPKYEIQVWFVPINENKITKVNYIKSLRIELRKTLAKIFELNIKNISLGNFDDKTISEIKKNNNSHAFIANTTGVKQKQTNNTVVQNTSVVQEKTVHKVGRFAKL